MYLLLFSTDRRDGSICFLFVGFGFLGFFFFSVHVYKREEILSCMLFGIFLNRWRYFAKVIFSLFTPVQFLVFVVIVCIPRNLC